MANEPTLEQLKYILWASKQPALAPILNDLLGSYGKNGATKLTRQQAWEIINTLKMKMII